MIWDNLVGIPFNMGSDDCFELGRKFYKQNFGLEIASYARPKDWDADKLNLIEACFEREGFEKITHWKAKDLRPGDALCMAIGTAAPNHFSVYVGDNHMIHHLVDRMSSDEPYRDFWRNVTCFVLRHPSVPDLRPVLPEKDLGEILRERLNFAPAAQPAE
jgi:cell wall-associated NlpC family hydrolase